MSVVTRSVRLRSSIDDSSFSSVTSTEVGRFLNRKYMGAAILDFTDGLFNILYFNKYSMFRYSILGQ